MKKIIWTGTNSLDYTENAQPPDEHLRENEVLVRITAVGLCSTDVHIIEGKVRFKDPPHVLGHEISGIIEEIGTGVTRVKHGDRITVDSVIGCGVCKFCLRGSAQFCPNGSEIGMTVDGGMQEFLKIPEKNVYPIPDRISDEESAILDTEVFGALKKPGIEKDCSLVVIGPGPGGLIAVQLAKIFGAGKVILIGTRPERLQLGKRFGADITIDALSGKLTDTVLEATGGYGPDIVFDAAGTSSSLSLAINLVCKQGKVILYGVHGSPVPSVDIDQINLKDMIVYGALSDRVGWENIIEWVANGSLNLKDIITHRFPFKDVMKAYETIRDRREGAIKAVLYP